MRAANIWPNCATSSPGTAARLRPGFIWGSIISQASGEPWSLEEWQRHDKAGFFAACDGWMSEFRGDA